MTLNPEGLIARARRDAGMEDFGPEPLVEPLAVLCRALNEEAGLTTEAQAAAEASIRSSLVERLKVEDWLRRHPEILHQPIKAPLDVFGLPRSGTTALSQLLSEDPAMRSIRRWEINTPTPPPDDAVGDRDPRIEVTRRAIRERDRKIPTYRSMLPVSVEDISEHNALVGLTFLSLHTATLYHVPSYAKWLLTNDLTPGYAYLAKVLKLLQWKTPRDRWNLKAPLDMFAIPEFTANFPDAKFLWVHRDPASAIGSYCSLIITVREAGGQTVDKRALGPYLAGFLAEGLDRAMQVHDGGRGIVDINNHDLGQDPVGTIRAAYRRHDIPFTVAFRERLEARLQNRPRGQFGKHTYALEDYGLSKVQVREMFRDYTDRFNVPLEA